LTRLPTPDRASPALLLLNRNLYKWRTTKRVWCVDFHCEGGIHRYEWDLHRLGEVGLVPGGGRPGGVASTDSGFSFSCRHVSTKAQAELSQILADWPAPGPTWSMCQIHPHGDDDFDIWSTSLCQPLQCSNLLPKFLKSNKH
jgi:hypothetical protein